MFENKQLTPGKYTLQRVEETRADVAEQSQLTSVCWLWQGRQLYRGMDKRRGDQYEEVLEWIYSLQEVSHVQQNVNSTNVNPPASAQR